MSTAAGPGDLADTVCGWQRRIDEVCDRFEEAWRGGAAPRLEDFLNTTAVPPARRATLLGELLKVERELRSVRGDRPGASEYLDRFPGYSMVVRSVFGDDRIGRYELIGPIGEGGMGIVYRARHRDIGRVVALKMIRPFYLDDSNTVDRFQLEAQIAARLEHEHIVPIYEAGQDGGQHFYTMRYIAGPSLTEVINHKPLDDRRAARYLEQVARAVDHAHTRGVLHRDLKPRNILIDGADQAYITDFGMAKVLDGNRGATLTGDRLGTPSYMSPEQVRDPSRAGVASDIYSLGATLYEALTGRPPFVGPTPLEVMEKIGRDEPTPPRALNPDCARDLETICLKCLEKDPARRYPTALELANDLRRYLDGVPIRARRVGPVERARKWTRRHPAPTALAAVSLIAILALAGIAVLKRALTDTERGYRQARLVVDEVAQFGERRLRDQPKLLRELLEILSREQDDFLSRYQGDPKFAREVAATLTRMARLMDLVGSLDDALKAHEQALQLRRTLTSDSPERQAEIAETLHEIGVLQRSLGHPGRAIASYRQALEIRRRLVAAHPDNRAFLSDLARSYGYIGDWERENGYRDAARASYLQAEQIRERLVQSDPEDLVARFQLARSYNNAGYLERESGNLAEALRQHGRAIALQRALAALNPEASERQMETKNRNYTIRFADFQDDLASSYLARGAVYGELGQPDKARNDYVRAQVLYEALARQHPGTPWYEGELARTLTELGLLRGSQDDLDRAQALFETLATDNPGVTRFQAGRARNQAASGELARRAGQADTARRLLNEARAAQEALVIDHPDDFDLHQDLERTLRSLGRLDP